MQQFLLGSLLTLSTSFALTAQNTVFDVIAGSGDYNTLEAALIQTGLDSVLSAESDQYTVFAPADAAFDALPPEGLTALLADTALLREVLLYHVVAGATVTSGDVAAGQSFLSSAATTLVQDVPTGLSIQVVNDEGIVLNAQATVGPADLAASNGVVHSIDGVISPLTLTDVVANSPSHNTLEQLITDEGLAGVIDGQSFLLTLYAPTDSAFAALPEGALASLAEQNLVVPTLIYHLLGFAAPSSLFDGGDFAQPIRSANGAASQLFKLGDQLGIRDVAYTPTDVITTGGVVQVIDEVLTIPTTVEFVEFSLTHTALELALDTAGLTDAVDGLGGYTLFAPQDAAFADLGDALEPLLGDSAQLADILTYHVVTGGLNADSLAQGVSYARSLGGPSLTLDRAGTGNDATTGVDGLALDFENLQTLNGLVHVPAGVLTPNNVVELATLNPDLSTLVEAVTAAELAGTLSSDSASYTVFAPTNAAFDGLGATLATLLEDPTGDLAQILLYHVLGTEVPSQTIIDSSITLATTLQNTDVAIAVDSAAGAITVDSAVVVVADVFGTNGVVHVIDAVLIPDTIFSATRALATSVGVTVGPIPAADYTDVTIPAELGDRFALTLFDAAGVAVQQRQIGAGTTRLDLGSAAAGAYFLLLRDGGGDAYYQPLVVR